LSSLDLKTIFYLVDQGKKQLQNVTSRPQDFNFLYFRKKEFGIGSVWKDVSDVSFAGQRAVAWAASRTHMSQVPDVSQRIIWLVWHRLEQRSSVL